MSRRSSCSAPALLLLIGAAACGGDPTGPPYDVPPTVQQFDDWEPAWSPDGSEIAVRSNRATRHVPEQDPRSVLYNISHHDLFLLDTLGNAVRLTDGLGDLPPSSMEGMSVKHHSWSPDGRIAFVSGRSIRVVDRDGSGLTELLAHEGLLGHVAWSPEGDVIAFSWTPGCSSSGACSPHRISLLDVGTGSVTLLTDPDAPSTFPAWSPDGSQLAFIRRSASGGPGRIMRMDSDGSNVVELREDGGTDLAWSPCGDRIALSRFTGGQHSVVLMDADGSDLQVLTPGEQPAWSPDCSKLAFIRPLETELGYDGIDVWMIGADGTGERKITRRE